MSMQWLGYVAAGLVFATFYMHTMQPLRCVAIASNVVFLAYAIPLGLWPIVILHGLLLPLNVLRLVRIHRMLGNIRSAQAGEIDAERLMSLFVIQKYARDTVLFRKGDRGEGAYYVVSGQVELPEIGIRVGRGAFFGEVSIFSSGRARTASAICVTDVELYLINERDLVTMFYLQPSMAFAIVRLIADHMSDNLERLEAEIVRLGLGAKVDDVSR